jgi:transcriptional regulator with XRE-family HTH domain
LFDNFYLIIIVLHNIVGGFMPREFILDKILGERGFSVADLSRMTKLGRSTIDNIRREGSGRRENLDKIAFALGIEYDYLYENVEVSNDKNYINTFIYDNSELTDIAVQYKNNGNEKMYQRFIATANKIGKDITEILNIADLYYSQGQIEEATHNYQHAALSLKPRHIERFIKSVPYYFEICKLSNDIQPIIDLFYKFKEPEYRNLEMLCMILIFFANNYIDESLINNCLDVIDKM